VHYQNRRLCRVPEALDKALTTLGKLFAECRTRQRGLGIQCIGKAVFVEYFFLGTRQRKAAVTATGDGDGVFAECLPDSTRQRIRQRGPHVRYFTECLVWHSAKRASLTSARASTLGKEPIPVPMSWFFTECYGPDTRQSTSLPSVTLGKVTSIHLFICFLYSIQTNKIYHIYITYITYIHHRYHHKHKYPTQTQISKFSTQT
jgi:hypothetical protein